MVIEVKDQVVEKNIKLLVGIVHGVILVLEAIPLVSQITIEGLGVENLNIDQVVKNPNIDHGVLILKTAHLAMN